MNCDKKSMLLYAVTDRSWLGGETLAEQVEKALIGGATFVQLREKSLNRDEFIREAFEIRELCAKYKVPFVINDEVEIAKLVDADGVHVGQSDMAAADVRSFLGKNKIIGVSASTAEEAVLAEKMGADYIGTGAVFPTNSKCDAGVCGVDKLKEVCSAVSIPVVAIGGINEENILQLSDTGVDGVAVISAIFAQPDITSAARRLKALSEKMVNYD